MIQESKILYFLTLIICGHHADIGLHSGYYVDLFCWLLFVCIFLHIIGLPEASSIRYCAPAHSLSWIV